MAVKKKDKSPTKVWVRQTHSRLLKKVTEDENNKIILSMYRETTSFKLKFSPIVRFTQ